MNRDFVDLLRELSVASADSLLIGAYAVAFHTEPRFTGGLDVWIRPTPTNARRVMRALEAFRAPLGGLTVKDLSDPEVVFQIGLEPNRIDLLCAIEGVDFADAWERRVVGPFGPLEANWISAADLLTNKKAVARPQDLLDVARLQPVVAAARKKR